MGPRTGRPPKGMESKSVNLQLRITPTTANKLEKAANALEVSRTEVIERGIDMIHKQVVKEK